MSVCPLEPLCGDEAIEEGLGVGAAHHLGLHLAGQVHSLDHRNLREKVEINRLQSKTVPRDAVL